MQVTHTHCGRSDVDKQTVGVCCVSEDDNGSLKRETRTFSTFMDRLRMREWVAIEGITQVTMESTGEYEKPVDNVLESSYAVIVVNSHHCQQVPGRKTDVKDAAWLAELLHHG